MPSMNIPGQGIRNLGPEPYIQQARLYRSCDLDLDPMTSLYNLDLDVLKMYLQTRNELLQFERYGQTDAQTDAIENVTIRRTRGW